MSTYNLYFYGEMTGNYPSIITKCHSYFDFRLKSQFLPTKCQSYFDLHLKSQFYQLNANLTLSSV